MESVKSPRNVDLLKSPRNIQKSPRELNNRPKSPNNIMRQPETSKHRPTTPTRSNNIKSTTSKNSINKFDIDLKKDTFSFNGSKASTTKAEKTAFEFQNKGTFIVDKDFKYFKNNMIKRGWTESTGKNADIVLKSDVNKIVQTSTNIVNYHFIDNL